MRQLHPEAGAGSRDRPRGVEGAAGGGRVVVGIEPEAAVRDAAAPLDVGHLEGHHAGAGHRQHHPVLQVPVGGRAVVGGILAHRRDGDAVRKIEAADLDRREERGGHVGSRRVSPAQSMRIGRRFQRLRRRAAVRACPHAAGQAAGSKVIATPFMQ
jgi:hypothetical protein